eukprot:comp21727_c0_seq1/m.48462 comp21727_c0_seq1/g.48462  ORF comp21727_c0_seq1/g.48462 comp21727_c0_seq1/m.48462 type:complete len:393 (-) comp21727_c0_seq1:277-1455(-)
MGLCNTLHLAGEDARLVLVRNVMVNRKERIAHAKRAPEGLVLAIDPALQNGLVDRAIVRIGRGALELGVGAARRKLGIQRCHAHLGLEILLAQSTHLGLEISVLLLPCALVVLGLLFALCEELLAQLLDGVVLRLDLVAHGLLVVKVRVRGLASNLHAVAQAQRTQLALEMIACRKSLGTIARKRKIAGAAGSADRSLKRTSARARASAAGCLADALEHLQAALASSTAIRSQLQVAHIVHMAMAIVHNRLVAVDDRGSEHWTMRPEGMLALCAFVLFVVLLNKHVFLFSVVLCIILAGSFTLLVAGIVAVLLRRRVISLLNLVLRLLLRVSLLIRGDRACALDLRICLQCCICNCSNARHALFELSVACKACPQLADRNRDTVTAGSPRPV